MDVVAIIIVVGMALGSLAFGYYLGSRRSKEVLLAALTLAFDHSEMTLTFDEVVERVSHTMTTPEGARAIVALLEAARREREK